MVKYNTLFNVPHERRRITYPYVWWDNAFTDDQLNEIEKICSEEPLNDGTTIGDIDIEEVKKIRRSKVKFLGKNEKTSWIFDIFNFIGVSLNEQFYNFNINGYKEFQYTVYAAEDNGKYDWHMDTIMGTNLGNMESGDTRKLSLIMMLNRPGKDFTGGEFQINLGRETNPDTVDFHRGRIIAMPSFMIHRVAPVITGVRKSIVIWIEGPKFI